MSFNHPQIPPIGRTGEEYGGVSKSVERAGVVVHSHEVVCPPDVVHLLGRELRESRGAEALLGTARSYVLLEDCGVITCRRVNWMSKPSDLMYQRVENN